MFGLYGGIGEFTFGVVGSIDIGVTVVGYFGKVGIVGFIGVGCGLFVIAIG